MSVQHKEMEAGRWQAMTLMEQLANVGSEVSRALNWRAKENADYSMRAFERALELLDLTIACPAHRRRLKEIVRMREVIADFFVGDNKYGSTSELLNKQFLAYAVAARNGRANGIGRSS
jgi:hypothetical protein